jgi:hypothetical protein
MGDLSVSIIIRLFQHVKLLQNEYEYEDQRWYAIAFYPRGGSGFLSAV